VCVDVGCIVVSDGNSVRKLFSEQSVDFEPLLTGSVLTDEDCILLTPTC